MGKRSMTGNQILSWLNSIIWHPWVIWILLAVGVLFTLATKGCQFRSLSHGVKILFQKDSQKKTPGSINHFQTLSAALSATVGVGNIGGTALAIATGGPGALFWMWVVGFLGMSLKTMEVTLSMMYRKTVGEETFGGPMWVADRGLRQLSPSLGPFAKSLAGIFCATLLIATFTGGLFFQAWNASNVTRQFFGIPAIWVGVVLAFLVGLVILGGIKRIGTVASKIVPLMCGIYILAGLYTILTNVGQVPQLFGTIFTSAFSATEANGAFLGGTMGAVFAIGMRQAFFSNEAGQGSSPIIHSAAKTDEPAREGLVAGLEPFIDTIFVCTLTGLVILISGVWNRPADYELATTPIVSQNKDLANTWFIEDSELPIRDDRSWRVGDGLFLTASVMQQGSQEPSLQQAPGTVAEIDGDLKIQWQPVQSATQPKLDGRAVFESYDGASLTALAFDNIQPGLGRWLVTLATWLFGLSTMISWSYYGEQGVRYLFGERGIFPFRIVFCIAIVLSCSGLIQNRAELTNLANLGTGVMLWVNIPITLLFARQAIRQYQKYLLKQNTKREAAESNQNE